MSRWLPRFVLTSQLLCSAAACTAIQAFDAERFMESRDLIDQGVIALRAGEFDKARAAFHVAAELAAHPAALDGLGCVAFMTGDAPAAQKYFLAAYDSDNAYNYALAHLALLYETQGLNAEAAELYRQAVQHDPRLYEARNNLAAFLYDNKGATAADVRRELLKAEILAPHPRIKENLTVLNGASDGQDRQKN